MKIQGFLDQLLQSAQGATSSSTGIANKSAGAGQGGGLIDMLGGGAGLGGLLGGGGRAPAASATGSRATSARAP